MAWVANWEQRYVLLWLFSLSGDIARSFFSSSSQCIQRHKLSPPLDIPRGVCCDKISSVHPTGTGSLAYKVSGCEFSFRFPLSLPSAPPAGAWGLITRARGAGAVGWIYRGGRPRDCVGCIWRERRVCASRSAQMRRQDALRSSLTSASSLSL
ncbi:hypothetical protein C8R47DRAFT_304302 [Mycena vitilis]|nr:hypothetical protein C8R47DRAFT_304302 [Mycena vitilis]